MQMLRSPDFFGTNIVGAGFFPIQDVLKLGLDGSELEFDKLEP